MIPLSLIFLSGWVLQEFNKLDKIPSHSYSPDIESLKVLFLDWFPNVPRRKSPTYI
jgi:hypothetical protein